MLQDFVIQKAIGGHNLLPYLGYPFSHPHSWEALDASGKTCIIISRRRDYMPNLRIKLSVRPIDGTNAYIDSSPATLLNPGTASSVLYPLAPVASSAGQIDSDVILTVRAVETPDTDKTIVVGEVFYFDSRLRNLQDRSLRTAFCEKAAIRVITHLKPYNFNDGHTYTFENLRDVSYANNVIRATDARMPKP